MLGTPQRQITHLYYVLDETLNTSLLWRISSCKGRIYIWRFKEQGFEENFWQKEKTTSWDSFMTNLGELDYESLPK